MKLKFKTRELALEDVLFNIDYYSTAIEGENFEEIKYLVNLYQSKERTTEEIDRAIHYFESVESKVCLNSWGSFINCEIWDMNNEEYERVCEEGGI